jgi:hypothetical protein
VSGPVPTSLLVPPVRTAAVCGPGPSRPAQRRAGADSALFDLSHLRLQPTPQRAAALDAEETTPVQPKLDVGPADDAYEQEADALADRVMREPADDMEETEEDTVQPRRKCAACAAEDEVRRQVEVEEEEDTVQPRRQCAACAAEERVQRQGVAEAEAESGPPELAASPQKLTTGGSPLPDATRSFYENRLGRDLSAVRVHTGTPARAMSESINARAFTYGSHVWMGEGTAAPSHTLAHELTHVLQQTQPDEVRREPDGVAATARHVQRKSARWEPVPRHPGKRALGEFHKLVIEAISGANPGALAEVPIPNAGRKPKVDGVQPTFGFADFWKAAANPKAIPGVRLVPGNTTGTPLVQAGTLPEEEAETPAPEVGPAEPAPPATADPGDEGAADDGGGAAPGAGGGSPGVALANFNKTGADGWGNVRGAEVLHKGKTHTIRGNQHPRITGGKKHARISGTADAPRGVELGELKPGQNAKQRASGVGSQLPRYQTALENVAAAVGRANATDGSWNLGSVGRLNTSTSLTVPDGLKLNRTTTDKDFDRPLNLILRDYKKRTFKSTQDVPGKLVAGLDTSYGDRGGWTYVWMPKDTTLAADLAAGERGTFQRLATKLDDLIAKLKKSPAKAKRKARRQAVPPPPKPKLRRTRAVVRKRNDPFAELKPSWQKQRAALGREVEPLLEADAKSETGLQRGEAIADAFAEIAKDLKGFSAPKLGSRARKDLKKLRQMERMTGSFGQKIGALRLRFGGVFVKAIERYDAFRAKLDERANKKRSAGGGFGGWRKVVMTVLVAAVGEAIKVLAEDIARRFSACLDGIGEKVMERFAAEAEAEFGEEIAELERQIDAFLAEFEAFSQKLEAEAESWLAQIDDIDELLDDVERMKPILTGIEVAVRGLLLAMSCSGAGIGCIVGIVGQAVIGEFLSWAADTDRFKKAVINPEVRKLVEPLTEEAYAALMDLMLRDAETGTARGKLKELVDQTPACKLPSKDEILKSCGFGTKFPVAANEAERTRLIGELATEFGGKHRKELHGKLKEMLTNPEAMEPVTGDQVEGVEEAIGTSGLTARQFKEVMDKSRGTNGKVDLGKLQKNLEEARPGPRRSREPGGGRPDADVWIYERRDAPGDATTPRRPGGITIFEWD